MKNVTIKPIGGYDETMAVYEAGLAGRHTRATKMNEESSRSHLIFSIIISATNKQNGKRTEGKLSFIDLAGSESSKKTGLSKKDEGFEEATAINASLSALGNVISALASGKGIPRYRDNILTRLMEDSLGNNAKTLMFVNASPSVYNEAETKNSLEYAKRVKDITNNPTLNIETKNMAVYKAKLGKQRDMIDSLKGLLSENGLGDQLAELLAAMNAQADAANSDGEQEDEEEEEEDAEGGQADSVFGDFMASILESEGEI